MADYQNINLAGKTKEEVLAWIEGAKAWGKGYEAPVFVTAGTGVVIAENLRALEDAVKKDLPGYIRDKFDIMTEQKLPPKVIPKPGRKKR